jgi:hypothetical protein
MLGGYIRQKKLYMFFPLSPHIFRMSSLVHVGGLVFSIRVGSLSEVTDWWNFSVSMLVLALGQLFLFIKCFISFFGYWKLIRWICGCMVYKIWWCGDKSILSVGKFIGRCGVFFFILVRLVGLVFFSYVIFKVEVSFAEIVVRVICLYVKEGYEYVRGLGQWVMWRMWRGLEWLFVEIYSFYAGGWDLLYTHWQIFYRVQFMSPAGFLGDRTTFFIGRYDMSIAGRKWVGCVGLHRVQILCILRIGFCLLRVFWLVALVLHAICTGGFRIKRLTWFSKIVRLLRPTNMKMKKRIVRVQKFGKWTVAKRVFGRATFFIVALGLYPYLDKTYFFWNVLGSWFVYGWAFFCNVWSGLTWSIWFLCSFVIVKGGVLVWKFLRWIFCPWGEMVSFISLELQEVSRIDIRVKLMTDPLVVRNVFVAFILWWMAEHRYDFAWERRNFTDESLMARENAGGRRRYLLRARYFTSKEELDYRFVKVQALGERRYVAFMWSMLLLWCGLFKFFYGDFFLSLFLFVQRRRESCRWIGKEQFVVGLWIGWFMVKAVQRGYVRWLYWNEKMKRVIWEGGGVVMQRRYYAQMMLWIVFIVVVLGCFFWIVWKVAVWGTLNLNWIDHYLRAFITRRHRVAGGGFGLDEV